MKDAVLRTDDSNLLSISNSVVSDQDVRQIVRNTLGKSSNRSSRNFNILAKLKYM